jgi:hypothetical protein
MRVLKITTLVVAVALSLTGLLQAKQNKYGVADVRKITFTAPVRVGQVLLPQGEYEVRHVMEAQSHIMLFRQLGTSKPAEARVKCKLVPLKAKAESDQVIYVLNAANEKVLQTLTFRGDLAQHVF